MLPLRCTRTGPVRGSIRIALLVGSTGPADHNRLRSPLQSRKPPMASPKLRPARASGAAPGLKAVFEDFNQRNANWLFDYAFFMALKEDQGGACWQEWPAPLRTRQPEALASARSRLAERIGRQQFRQFLFARQWEALREYARSASVKIMGDAPIFVCGDSADVWTNPHLFLLDLERRQRVDAGVPPDYFSPTGQLW